MTFVVHARWSGQAGASGRRPPIRRARSQAQPGVQFMRRCDIARWWLDRYPPA